MGELEGCWAAPKLSPRHPRLPGDCTLAGAYLCLLFCWITQMSRTWPGSWPAAAHKGCLWGRGGGGRDWRPGLWVLERAGLKHCRGPGEWRCLPPTALRPCSLIPGSGCSGLWSFPQRPGCLEGRGCGDSRLAGTPGRPPSPGPARLWECGEPRVGGRPSLAWPALCWTWGAPGVCRESPGDGFICQRLEEERGRGLV